MSQSRVFLFRGNCLVVPESMNDDEAPDGVLREMADKAFGSLDYYAVPPIGLTTAPEDPPLQCFLFGDDVPLPPSWRSVLVRQLISVMAIAGDSEDDRVGWLLRCYHIIQWRNESVYCGSCGERNGDSPDELARLCPSCGRLEFPRIAPAVIVLISDDNGRVILAHNRKFKNNVYSLIAGFNEAGESLEATIHREIKEELSIDVKDIRYVKSQSWPFPNAVMIGFTARYAGGEIKPDGTEIVDARWFTRETIMQSIEGAFSGDNPAEDNSFVPELPGPGSISRYLIDKWIKGKVPSSG